MPDLTRRQLIRRAVFGLGGAGLLGGGMATAQAYAPAQLNVHVAPLAGLQAPLQVALLTDLHYGPYIHTAQVRGWVERTRSARPDLILLAGDLLDERMRGPADLLLAELGRLSAPLGVYAVWGNHDYGYFGRYGNARRGPANPDWARERTRLQAQLAEAGIRVLTNQGVSVRPDLYVAGVDDLSWGEPAVGAALQAAPAGSATLLMTHNPDLLPQLPAGLGLTVCGHTHGGQVRFPLIGAPVVPSRYGQRFAQGWIHDPVRAFVSRGLGVSGLPVRNLCPSEVVLLKLQPTHA
ncbi:metallophosphoesterase [Deinococcus sonorensis]|uniref:Metallophosphoesterase n=2 Tax=Deinococcus sonorensis TaxID=309891 RepID=A0AAU7U7X1_9DEIO